MDEPEPISPEEAAQELKKLTNEPASTTATTTPENLEPLNPEAAARELKSGFTEHRIAPIRTGTAIAGINLGVLAIAAQIIGVHYRLHDHGALPFVVAPFAAVGFMCGCITWRKWLGIAALVLNTLAAGALLYTLAYGPPPWLKF
jgi:hypothetical protein